MRLINADALEKKLHEMALDEWNQKASTSWSNALLECEDMVYDAPTVDPIKHGHWEVVDAAEPRRWGCSNCRCLSWHEFYYCPNCGAKMDGVET